MMICKVGFFGVAYICLVKILHIGLLVVTNISLQYNSTVTAYPVTFFPDCNPVIELTITKCTTDTDTVHSPDTAHTKLDVIRLKKRK